VARLWIPLMSLCWLLGSAPLMALTPFNAEYELRLNDQAFGKSRMWLEQHGDEWRWHSESRAVGMLSLFTRKKPSKMSRLQAKPEGGWRLLQHQDNRSGKDRDERIWNMQIEQRLLLSPEGNRYKLPLELYDSLSLPLLLEHYRETQRQQGRFFYLSNAGARHSTLKRLADEAWFWQQQEVTAQKWQVTQDQSEDILEVWMLPEQLGVVPLKIRRTRADGKVQELRLISVE